MLLSSSEISSRLVSDLRLGVPIILFNEQQSVLAAAIETLSSEKLEEINQVTKNKKFESLRICVLDRPRHQKIIDEAKSLNIDIKLISDGDVSGALLVTEEKHNIDLFLGTGGGPEGVLAASALDTYGCGFQGRFIFDTDELKKRANNMGINDFDKKYKLDEIVKGDSLFCATGITKGDLVNGVKLSNNKMVVNTLITHKSQNMKKIVTGEIDIKK